MLLLPLVLSLIPASSTAKLWGWPDSFTVTFRAETPQDANLFVCPGWGSWCGDCVQVQDFKITSAGGQVPIMMPETWTWAHLQKDGSAWVDFWRQGKSDTFNMYETNKDGTVHGQCQLVDFHRDTQNCGDHHVMVFLNCWQW